MLTTLRFTGTVSALPDGTVVETTRVRVPADVRERYADRPVPLSLVMIESGAAEVALLSQGVAAILDFAIEYSTRLFADVRARRPAIFYASERDTHPYWARFAATIERALDVQNPLSTPADTAWLWVDERRDGDLRRRAERSAVVLESLGRTPLMLIRREEPWP